MLERNKKRWPRGVDSCVRCGALSSDVTYASRGLCTPCHGAATRDGTIRQYQVVRRGGNTGVSDAYKAHLTRRRNNKALYYCVSHLGATEVAQRLAVTVSAVSTWMKAGAPDEYDGPLEELYAWIRHETREAERGRRLGQMPGTEKPLQQTAWEMRESILEQH